MTKIINILLIILLTITTAIAQKSIYYNVKNSIWTYQTALTIPEKQMQISALFFSKYGITNKIQIETQPFFFYKIPNLNLKINWWTKPPKATKKFYKRIGFAIGSLHGIYYPTPLLKYIEQKHFLGLNLNNKQIPATVVFRNELIFSIIDSYKKGCGKKIDIYSIYVGTAFVPKQIKHTLVAQKNAYWYRKTSVFNNSPIWYIGLNSTSNFNYGLYYAVDLAFYSIGLNVKSFTIEQKTIFYTLWLTHLRVAAGYKVALSNELNIKPAIYPIVDLSLIFFTKKHKRQKKNKKDYISTDELMPFLKKEKVID